MKTTCRFAVLLAVVLAAALTVACRRPGVRAGELHVGYMICNSEEETRQRFAPLSAWLGDVLGVPVVPHYIHTYEFEKELARGQLQLAHTNSLLYVILHENHGWELVAGEREGSNGARTAGVILVREDSPLSSVADLKGKRMIFGPELAPFAFLSQYDLLLENGFDPEQDLAFYSFAKGAFSHEQAVYAVLYGGYDAASVPLLDLENMEREGKVAPGELRILARGELAPYCTFSASPDTPETLKADLRKALAGLTRDVTARVGGEVLRVLDRAKVDGFELLEDRDYDPIRRMARRVNMPPYQVF